MIGAALTPDEQAALSYTLYEYPLGSPQLEDALRRLTPAVERIVADRERAAAAEALREAAEEIERVERIGLTHWNEIATDEREWFSRHPLRNVDGYQRHRPVVADWLRDRANGVTADA